MTSKATTMSGGGGGERLDSYDAEIVEDIPEQFDLSRYKKTPVTDSKLMSSSSATQSSNQVTSQYQNNLKSQSNTVPSSAHYNSNLHHQQYAAYNNYQNNQMQQQQQQKYYSSAVYGPQYNRMPASQQQVGGLPPRPYHYQMLPPTQAAMTAAMANQHYYQQMQSNHHHQQNYNYYPQQVHHQPPVQVPTPQTADYTNKHQQFYAPKSDIDQGYTGKADSTMRPSKSIQSTSSHRRSSQHHQNYRKKNSFDDDDDDDQDGGGGGGSGSVLNSSDPSQFYKPKKKEYFLRDDGNEETSSKEQGSISLVRKWPSNDDLSSSIVIQRLASQMESGMKMSSATSSASNLSATSSMVTATMPKKSSLRKPGVTFDEKLEVYEVKNPHYGAEVKTEKREMKRRKRDKLKEKDFVQKTLVTMMSERGKMIYYVWERNAIYNALVYFEDNFYKLMVNKIFDKFRGSKPDDKLRDQLLQWIERDNQVVCEIVKLVRKEYAAKVEPYCKQYMIDINTATEHISSIPGIVQILAAIVTSSINYAEIVTYCVNSRDALDSPSTLRKFLGHDFKSEKFLSTNQAALLNTIRTPAQRKHFDLLALPKEEVNAIDYHVGNVCHLSYKNIRDIVGKLSEISRNDMQLVRAIYKYVIQTQLENLRNSPFGSAGFLMMRNFDAGIESVNTIFSRLCSFAGISNHLVRGLWKTILQEPGEKVDTKSVWNIVNLECGWRFVQPAFTPVKYHSRQEIGYEETEFYFLSDSEHLFWEFMPNDKQWQFNHQTDQHLNIKDLLKEFEKRPIVTPVFRTLNLSIVQSNHQTSCGNIGKEAFKLALKFPSDLADSINFKYTLRPYGGVMIPSSSSSSHQGSSSVNTQSILNSVDHEYNANLYVISELISDENVILFKISALPYVGSFNLTIYASNIVDDINEEARAIMSFKLTCSKLVPFEIPPNRITNNEIGVFGTNLLMKRLGLVCCDFKQGILGTDREGKLNLVFEMSQPLDIEAYLYSSDQSISSKCLELCMLKRVVHNFLILIINPPHPGLYGLDLHGAQRGSFNSLVHGTQLPPVAKFLIKSHHQIRSFFQFPKGDNRQWGPKQRFYDLGLHTIGNMDPYIVNEDGKQYEIEIAMLKPITFYYKFDFDMSNGSTAAGVQAPKPYDNFCFMNYKNAKTVSFLLRFPEKGFYHLALMANDDVYPTSPDEIVYNYLFRVQDPPQHVAPFPIILNPILWKDCKLVAPKNYILHGDVHFSIFIPNATQVRVINEQSKELGRLEPKEIENSWVGLVTVSSNVEHSKYIYVEAVFENCKPVKLLRFRDSSMTSHNKQIVDH